MTEQSGKVEWNIVDFCTFLRINRNVNLLKT